MSIYSIYCLMWDAHGTTGSREIRDELRNVDVRQIDIHRRLSY